MRTVRRFDWLAHEVAEDLFFIEKSAAAAS